MLGTVLLLVFVAFIIAMLINVVWGSMFATCPECKKKGDTVAVWANLSDMQQQKGGDSNAAENLANMFDDDSDEE